MKAILAAGLLLVSLAARAWGTSGLAYMPSYMQPGRQIPNPYTYNQQYNEGYVDGYNEAHGYAGRSDSGPGYEAGYQAARRGQANTYQLNHQ